MTVRIRLFSLAVHAIILVAPLGAVAQEAKQLGPDAVTFFELKVRPLLVASSHDQRRRLGLQSARSLRAGSLGSARPAAGARGRSAHADSPRDVRSARAAANTTGSR